MLTKCWFGLGTDGASIMLGSKSGVAAQLKALFPKIISWHCFNHRLELSVHDAIKSCVEINHFKTFMDSLYALYSQSPKLQRDLNSVAYELEVQILKIGRVLDVRWAASSFRTVKTGWQSNQALHAHFKEKSGYMTCDLKESKIFGGL